jgi:hypothetical protein
MFPIAFGIMFGNENKESWGEFWKFAAYHHPYLNDPKVTVITDQDKGSIHAIKAYLEAAHHYHCAWHRGGNIIKMCGGGKKTYSGWWYFNQLLQCCTPEEIEIQRKRHLGKIGAKALTYINKLEDTAQYPAARCAMAGNI